MAINKSNEEINIAFELIENGVHSFLDSDNYKKYDPSYICVGK